MNLFKCNSTIRTYTLFGRRYISIVQWYCQKIQTKPTNKRWNINNNGRFMIVLVQENKKFHTRDFPSVIERYTFLFVAVLQSTFAWNWTEFLFCRQYDFPTLKLLFVGYTYCIGIRYTNRFNMNTRTDSILCSFAILFKRF